MRDRFQVVAFTAAIFAFLGFGVAAGQTIDWTDLPDPAVQVFDDPYRDLSPEQFDDVLFVVRLRGSLQQEGGGAEQRQKWQNLLNETEDALTADGIDVDWLLSQRQAVTERRAKAGTAGKPIYDGQMVTLAGFAIPVPHDANGQAIAYLVPEKGMCSHMPPPPPNQMIRVRLNGDWAPSYFHEPVRLTGMLTIAPSDHRMVVVDGLMQMRATFLMEANKVEILESREDRLEWSESLADKLRAAGRRKTGGQSVSE